ncbi:MAG TPA: enoyl-CoA hydratase-related protein [Chloroflexota bacterium]|nr:enoyl-CoA hydratase-related protein [Chloroflexota bacterium]
MDENQPVLLTEQVGAVLTLTLNRPTRFNALDDELKDRLLAALLAASRDSGVRCVVLTGAGKAFCAGQDLNLDGDLRPEQVGDTVRRSYNKIARLLHGMEKPIIAAVNGVAAGAGMSLALACDLRVLAEHSSLRLAFSNIGLIPDCGATYSLSHLLPRGLGLEIAYTGRAIEAPEALRLGLANRVVADADLFTETATLAASLAARPTRALGLTKRAFNRATTGTLEDALEYEAYTQEIAAGTADFQEGIAAFREKRQPRFEGR